MEVFADKEQVVLGYKRSEGVIEFEFCPDPDGSALPWFKFTGKMLPLDGFVEIGTNSLTYSGACDDTAEYTSHLGELMMKLLNTAPNGTGLMVASGHAQCGTRTFIERAEATFYGKEA